VSVSSASSRLMKPEPAGAVAREPSGGGDPGSYLPVRTPCAIGENWRALLAAGVDQVSLLDDTRTEYGPMSLHPED